MSERLRVLMVEDDEGDAELARLALKRGGFELEWRRVDSADALRAALDEVEWDAVISDFAMPGFDGLSALSIVRERELDIPFIFVSGALGEERAVEAMRVGAHDYLIKGHLGRLAVAVRRELRASRSRRLKSRAEESLRRQQQRLALAVEVSGVGIFDSYLPPDERTFVADRCREIFGLTADELPTPEELPQWVRARVHPEDLPGFEAAWTAFANGTSDAFGLELRARHSTGHWLDLDLRGKAVERDERGRATRLVGVMRDVSEQRQLESRLRQNQKMEAIGRLAGGVAHDFNNLLSVIMACSSLALETLDAAAPARTDLEEVLTASRRAAELTNQLLSFSRNKKTSPRLVAPRDVVRDLESMLQRLIGPGIALRMHLPDGPARVVRIDPSELEQVLVNLTVNARDAMTSGGTLTIVVDEVRLEASLPGHASGLTAPGDFVRVTVSDTGTGIDAATMARIFDPFFTTKDLGKGTGLGLATCYGIAQRAGGLISVKSELGHGATFEFCIPFAST